MIVGTILDVAMHREAVKNEESARGLSGKLGIARGSIGKKVVYRERLNRPERSDRLLGHPCKISGHVARGHRGWIVPFLLQKL